MDIGGLGWTGWKAGDVHGLHGGGTAGPVEDQQRRTASGPSTTCTATSRTTSGGGAHGQLLDPWMRTHERPGARIATPLPHSLRITGTVPDWESWTDLAFPESGDYVFPEGLATVHIDRAADRGTYWEPNVWLIHPDIQT